MSIDARVTGVRRNAGGECILTLEQRDKYTSAGQPEILVLNPPEPWTRLEALIGCEIWGGSGFVMLGDFHIADREGYTAIRLRDNWDFYRTGFASKNSVRHINEAGEWE
jgi:hypothetical protein